MRVSGKDLTDSWEKLSTLMLSWVNWISQKETNHYFQFKVEVNPLKLRYCLRTLKQKNSLNKTNTYVLPLLIDTITPSRNYEWCLQDSVKENGPIVKEYELSLIGMYRWGSTLRKFVNIMTIWGHLLHLIHYKLCSSQLILFWALNKKKWPFFFNPVGFPQPSPLLAHSNS